MEHTHAPHEAGRAPGCSLPGHTLLCSGPRLIHTSPDAQLPPRSRPHFFPSQVLPSLSVSNQLTLALGFIRGLKKLGFSLEFIKAEWSGACRPPLPVWRAWAPHPHLAATTPCPAAGSQPGGPEEEARRVTLRVLRVLCKGPGWRADTGQCSETVQASLEREEAPTVSHLVPSPPEPGGTLPSSSLSARLEQCPPRAPRPWQAVCRLLSFPLGLALRFWKRAGRPRAGSLGPSEGPSE